MVWVLLNFRIIPWEEKHLDERFGTASKTTATACAVGCRAHVVLQPMTRIGISGWSGSMPKSTSTTSSPLPKRMRPVLTSACASGAP